MTTRFGWILIPLLLAGAPAEADEPKKPQPESKRTHMLVGGKVPAAREESPLALEIAAGRAPWLNALHIDKKSGFEMRQSFQLGERNVILGLKGPVMKRKRFGLAVEIRF